MAEIIWKKEGNIAILSINRPKALNALSREIIDTMDVLIEEIRSDSNHVL